MMMSEQSQREMLARMRRIEGQARGVQRMIEDDRDCLEILAQLASLRSAAYSASVALTEQYAMQCMRNGDGATSSSHPSPDEAVRSLVEVLLRTPH
jgi:DNA-binding FrmR family transcriptional regulator